MHFSHIYYLCVIYKVIQKNKPPKRGRGEINMKIKELTKEIMNIVVPEKEIEIVSSKASKAFIKALLDSKKVSKFLSKLPEYVEASKANEEERIAMLAFTFNMDESQEKEFKKMKTIFKDRNPESQNTRKDIAKVIMAPSYDLEKVLNKMTKKVGEDTMKTVKENKKETPVVKKEEKEVKVLPDVQKTVAHFVTLSESPDKIKELVNNPTLIKDMFDKDISKDLVERLISEVGVVDKEEAVNALMGMVISGIALINKTKEFATLEKWLTLVIEGKSFEEIMKALNVKKKNIKVNDDEPELGKKFAVLVNKVTGASTGEELAKCINKALTEFIDEGDELIDRLKEVESELKEESKANEKAADAVHAAVNTIKKTIIKPDPSTLYNQSSDSLKVMIDNGSLIVGETYIVKVGDNKYTARLICLGGEHYSFELGTRVSLV